jgi:hypothetical protein
VSTPGQYRIGAGNANGNILATLYFNPATGAIRANPAGGNAALEVTNSTGQSCPVNVTGPNGTQTFTVPAGGFTATVQQLAQRGITTKDDAAEFSVAVPDAR